MARVVERDRALKPWLSQCFSLFSNRIFPQKNLSITKMSPALLKKFFKRSSQRTDYERIRHPSPSASISERPVTNNLDTGTSQKPTSAENKDSNKNDIKSCSVQICPHETLSFERMKRIVHLPDFKDARDKIGAFTKAPGHHHALCSEGIYRCKPYPKDFGSLRGKGYYKYQRSFGDGYEGLVLYVEWSINLDELKAFAGSMSELGILLDVLDIHLCPHITISNSPMAAELFELCNPSDVEGDPVEAYEEAYRARAANRCTRCHTRFETYQVEEMFYILVTRYLGQGTSIYEGRWLAQCGEAKHRFRSFAVAALQGLKNSAEI